ncbi:long-chain fatty acid--CoA ligase [Salinarchaeum sp. IM2453]|uniref:AMP-dependent synthetase/ligase n=1 Tax=Salinarchaeum sp. IM2453 TaxID=2862870 RepID=UPI001C835560|nr:long-chain fatty acid--CoA ligase [Salinarchaeum sp. IM2453]QZA88008.1 long-chain fatty acid--CoA ligase [Salinarchaeum sp. IM2453]
MSIREAEQEYTHPAIDETVLPVELENAVERYQDQPAQQYKGGIYNRSLTGDILPEAPVGEFASISYQTLGQITQYLAAGFRDLGIEADDRVAIFSETRMEWAHADFGLLAAGATVTTVYPDVSDDKLAYLISDPNATAVIVDSEGALKQLLDIEDDIDISYIITMDTVDISRPDVLTLSDVYNRGETVFDEASYQSWLDTQEFDDLATLIYTSGTTGQPKGVKLTHRNLRSNLNQVLARYGSREEIPPEYQIGTSTQTVSFLPLAHVFERLAGHYLMFAGGASVAYAESPDTLQEDFQAIQPTTSTAVPRVYEKIYAAIREQATESAIKERIFNWAVDVAQAYHHTNNPGSILTAKHAIADQLVFQKVREELGGNIDFMISGGGSLSAELCALFHGMGLPIFEGYGLTETSPVISVNPPTQPKVGTIGPPVVGLDIHVDTAATTDGDSDKQGDVGELLVRGPNVTKGYWNKPAATDRSFEQQLTTDQSQAIEADGGTNAWFRTGDIVHHRPDGYLEFVERAKRVLVLSTGKNVAPRPIEDAFVSSNIIEQSVVIGDNRKFVAALLVPNYQHIREWAAQNNIDLPDQREDICTDDRVVDYIWKEVDRVNEQFDPHEQVKEFALLPEEFTVENGLLTPTMKKKRGSIFDRYESKIESIYEDS